LNILHIITRLIVGGAQENTLITCAGQHALGHEVTLLTGPSTGAEGTLVERARASGYRVIVTPHLVRAPHPVHDLVAYRTVQKVCRDFTPDVVHTHSSKAGVIGRAAAFALRKPLVVHTIHGLPFHPFQGAVARKSWIAAERWAARRCHGIITVAEAMTRQAHAAGVGTDIPFETIYSAMDVEPFVHPIVPGAVTREKLGIPKEAIVFGTIARLQPLKGHDDLLAVAKRVIAAIPNAHFMWVGDGIFRARFEQTIAAAGWQKHFTLTGLVPPTEVPTLVQAFDVLVHPSYREGLARALPQGALAGKPLISFDCDGAPEVCIPGQTGELVRTGDQQGLADAMIRLATDPARAAAMGRAGQALCLERFPAPVMVSRINAFYDRLQASRSKD
jgi:glycosyltransferase involved in cell wall biosynthesis